ncbi:hypothetical protein [Reyranella sp.]|jgi:hypothetical protein|uniref:hypothetical protein n=1 Tax=Reyranella sp. TaxID=1929291 RepID=UPI000BCA81C5|nr:hypothetical protein [Reyranella sp.]OYY44025.1 MAG: hypothetical protein B7Y57_07525 [Rhodospirillales bacterium 35-66-84]OYZ94701.1 MAG: hypothetical protein B7Y08_10405 [Rhodospirillales bacterium 24-66-33]OZB26225.1 MAG: hypothetical protein B7X63_09805 [Rhodospirillales bacterium 39-66-50]HQS15056.1 hypothetical protein [Reyranella sp.]HQT10865.1 hypothetical protein [Reyranella sp.]
MAKGGSKNTSDSSTPGDRPVVPPTDLYATSDIRFVTLEVGKLTAKVDRLIEDVGKHTGKVSDLERAVDRVKTAGWAFSIIIGVVGVVLWALFGENIKHNTRSVVAPPPAPAFSAPPPPTANDLKR